MSHFPTEPTEWRNLLEAALEHGSHAWGALDTAGMLPKDAIKTCWPPRVPEGAMMMNVGKAPYHLAALLNYIWQAWNGICEVYPKEKDEYDG